MRSRTATAEDIESPYAWLRLWVSVLLMTIGASGTYSIIVVLPRIQQEFGVSRADASFPYFVTLLAFGIGGIAMGRLSDRFGVMWPVMLGGVGLAIGFVGAGLAPSLFLFTVAQGVFIGLLGTAATFTPLVADTAHWFDRRRGLALAVCMSGNYAAGAVWPPVMQYFIEIVGWRSTYVGMGVFCLVSIVPLALVLRRRPPPQARVVSARPAQQPLTGPARPMGLPPQVALALLSVAGLACCVAMAMPQVHIVAYCGDLGFGAARGAEMLSLMLAMGVISRVGSGWISDRIGGLRTLLLGSLLQGIALLLFLPFKGLASLYLISALFGLFQGGIVPAYALIIREHFPAAQAGARTGTVLMATLAGMAIGGWMSGAIFDATGSYTAAFVNGTAWNALNLAIVCYLLMRTRRIERSRPPFGGMAAPA